MHQPPVVENQHDVKCPSDGPTVRQPLTHITKTKQNKNGMICVTHERRDTKEHKEDTSGEEAHPKSGNQECGPSLHCADHCDEPHCPSRVALQPVVLQMGSIRPADGSQHGQYEPDRHRQSALLHLDRADLVSCGERWRLDTPQCPPRTQWRATARSVDREDPCKLKISES